MTNWTQSITLMIYIVLLIGVSRSVQYFSDRNLIESSLPEKHMLFGVPIYGGKKKTSYSTLFCHDVLDQMGIMHGGTVNDLLFHYDDSLFVQ